MVSRFAASPLAIDTANGIRIQVRYDYIRSMVTLQGVLYELIGSAWLEGRQPLWAIDQRLRGMPKSAVGTGVACTACMPVAIIKTMSYKDFLAQLVKKPSQASLRQLHASPHGKSANHKDTAI